MRSAISDGDAALTILAAGFGQMVPSVVLLSDDEDDEATAEQDRLDEVLALRLVSL